MNVGIRLAPCWVIGCSLILSAASLAACTFPAAYNGGGGAEPVALRIESAAKVAANETAAITVELINHTDTEWPENLRGMMAVLALFAEDSR